MNKLTYHFCCGCGLCNVDIGGSDNANGFFRPFSTELRSEKEIDFNEDLCYVNQLKNAPRQGLWGSISMAYYGYSSDADTRRRASSGGILTELTRYLLNQKIVDEVLTVEAPNGIAITTQPICLKSAEEADRCIGSKYTASKTLFGFLDAVHAGDRYAVIGRPCEIRVLRAYLDENNLGCKVIFLSFFCGGTPSKQANEKLLKAMGVSEDELESFSYRGDGWPGKTRAKTIEGKRVEMEYETSWGKILGRDIQPICRYCWEGTGEAADIVCGDGWYLENGKPSFEERLGRNVILARSKEGQSLLEGMRNKGLISLNIISDISVLNEMQPGHFLRKSSMFSRVLAAKLMRRPVPPYEISELVPYARLLSIKANIRMFLGTIRRALSGRL